MITSISTFKDKGHLHDVVQRWLVQASGAYGYWKVEHLDHGKHVIIMTLHFGILLQNSRPTITLPGLFGCCIARLCRVTVHTFNSFNVHWMNHERIVTVTMFPFTVNTDRQFSFKLSCGLWSTNMHDVISFSSRGQRSKVKVKHARFYSTYRTNCDT